MHRSKLLSYRIAESIQRPVLVWRRGQQYDIIDSGNLPSDFVKLNSLEAKVTRAGVTERMTLRVFANRNQDHVTKLNISPPVSVRRASMTHRGRKFRIRAPQKTSDCGYTRLLDRLVEGDRAIDELIGDFRPALKIVKSTEPLDNPKIADQVQERAVLFIPSAGKITSKGRDVTLSKEPTNAPLF
jgi:hypothetical protein